MAKYTVLISLLKLTLTLPLVRKFQVPNLLRVRKSKVVIANLICSAYKTMLTMFYSKDVSMVLNDNDE